MFTVEPKYVLSADIDTEYSFDRYPRLLHINWDNGYKEELLSGGWSSNHNASSVVLSEKAQNAFNQAANTYKGDSFLPVTLLASGEHHYVILCKDNTMFSVVTIKDNKVTNVYNLDLASFNK